MRAALVVGLLAACSSQIPNPGTLPGEAQGALTITAGQVTAETVDPAGAPTEREGRLAIARYTAGVYFGITRFGTMSGIEASLAGGWLTGAATRLTDDSAEVNSLYLDAETGGVLQPLALNLGKAVFRIAGEFGVGFTRDDRYTYAGGRLGGGIGTRRWAIDASFRRRFGDVPGNRGAHEDHVAAQITFRPGKQNRTTIHVGLERVRGDQRTLVGGVELGRDDYLLRGRYQMTSIVLGFGAGSDPKHTRLDF